jgi:UDP-N-acetylmuramyl pentapeptide synthase
VLELGMNHKGEIEYLSEICRPDIAIITNISEGHIGYFDSLEEIALAKLEICKYMNKNSILLLNKDDRLCDFLVQHAKKSNHGNFQIEFFSLADAQKIKIFKTGGKFFFDNIEFSCNLKTKFQILYFIIFVKILRVLTAEFRKKLENLAKNYLQYHFPSGRFEIKKNKQYDWYLIDDSYNANYASVASAMDAVFELFKTNHKVAILGEMAELGNFSEKLHKKAGEDAVKIGMDMLIAVGPKFARFYLDGWKRKGGNMNNCIHFRNIEEFKQSVEEFKKKWGKETCILVKGSRSTRMEEFLLVLEEM